MSAPAAATTSSLGGITPADSPFLRRPDLLASVIAYWQSHPALSYLFAGQFVGPTSQAPRVDEARHESLYELEIAFAPGARSPAAPSPPGWSTACSATCSSTPPATPTAPRSASTSSTRRKGPMGRLGLVEFRAFEMPPHARMSLAQQLLVRALLAWFWERPYRRRSCAGAPRCTTASCCRTSCGPTSRASSPTLRDAGLPLEARWFAPHFEFRFPVLGTVERAGRRRSSCARRSSRGSCSASRADPAPPRAPSIPRWSGIQVARRRPRAAIATP